MGKILDELEKKGILVSDGAWGTMLHQKGLAVGDCPESWNLDRPDDVFDIALSYVEAGADMVLTNSFGGSPLKLKAFGLEEKAHEINLKAAQISRKAAGERALVLGSVGPTGKMLFMGEVSGDELLEGFSLQAAALEKGGADAILVETMSDPAESTQAVRGAREATGLEVICTFTFEQTRQGEFRTMMGTSVVEAVDSAIEAGATIVGANCGNGTAGMIRIVQEIREKNPLIPLLVHANAGLPVLEDGKTRFPEGPEEMALQMKSLMEAGANMIGGCCGTTPEHIRQIVQQVRSFQNP